MMLLLLRAHFSLCHLSHTRLARQPPPCHTDYIICSCCVPISFLHKSHVQELAALLTFCVCVVPAIDEINLAQAKLQGAARAVTR